MVRYQDWSFTIIKILLGAVYEFVMVLKQQKKLYILIESLS